MSWDGKSQKLPLVPAAPSIHGSVHPETHFERSKSGKLLLSDNDTRNKFLASLAVSASHSTFYMTYMQFSNLLIVSNIIFHE